MAEVGLAKVGFDRCGVVTSNKRRRITLFASVQQSVRVMLTEKTSPKRNPFVAGTRHIKESGARPFFQCHQLWIREQREVQTTLATIQECGFDDTRSCHIGRTRKPVLRVLRRSLTFDVAQALACEQRSRWRPQKKCRLLARASIMNL